MADGSKTEQPTQHRQREARRKGDVPRSRDLVLTGSLFFAMIIFAVYLPTMGRLLTQNMRESLAMAGERTVTVLSLRQLAGTSFQLYLKLLLPLFLTIIAAVFLLTVAQGGFKFLLERIKFKATPFQFMKGLRRIFGSVDTLVELLKTM
ncbi:MAG TPA: EscU/YscU/HrcU family type III secretion system export apparatus switch protein, partial [Candidatus Aminicenantes bacterium]|nr:EscU/YscU/HrcU family type III secretion system export apparatus switch protein [Candidatus Aminicenantes bacterium]